MTKDNTESTGSISSILTQTDVREPFVTDLFGSLKIKDAST